MELTFVILILSEIFLTNIFTAILIITSCQYNNYECQKYNLPFIDTSHNRNEKIEELINKITKR